MYNINYSSGANKEPWLIPLEDRCSLFFNAKKNGKKVSLLLYEAPDTSTFRYRGYNIFKASQDSSKWQSIYFFLYEYKKILEILPNVDLVVIIRVRWTNNIDQIIYRAKVLNIKVLFDTDDLVFDINYINLVTNTLNVKLDNDKDYEYWFTYIGRIGFTASKADGFITTNSFLGEKLKEKFNKPYGIISNFLNSEQVNVSNRCLNIKETQLGKKPFTIGYFSGTPSHINDFRVIYPEVMELLNEFPGIRLKVVGFMEFPEEMTRLIKAGKVVFHPLVDFMELQKLIAEVDVNIVPLVNNTFTNCKSELKFFEAAIVNTLTLATPTFTYRNCITDGYNGFLCRPGEWYLKLKKIYTGKIDCSDIVKRANSYAMENYYGKKVVDMIDKCYEELFCEKIYR